MQYWINRSAIRFLGAAAAAALCALVQPALAQTVISPAIAQVFEVGPVIATARQADGKIIIGGTFSHVNGVSRNNIARLNADGSLDATWNPGANAQVSALALDGSNNVYAGGSFTNIGGQSRSFIAKLPTSGSGAADPTWNPGTSSTVNALAVDAGGNVYAGGFFTTAGGQPRSRIAKLSGSGAGAADPTWNPGASATVRALLLDGSGNLFVGGSFTTIGGQGRNGLAKLSAGTGVVDGTWNPNVASVSALVLDGGTSSLYVGGSFATIGGQSRSNIAKVSTSGAGAVDATWNPGANSIVLALALDGGSLYAGGGFTSIGGQSRNRIAKLSSGGSGAVDLSWNAAATFLVAFPSVAALALDGSGNPIAGGVFNGIGGTSKAGLALLDKVSATASSAWPSLYAPGRVNAIVRDASGRTVIGGAFSWMGDRSTLRRNIARFAADGTLDAGWSPNADGEVSALALDQSANLYVGGTFASIGGQNRNNVAKVSTVTGAADATWNPSASASVYALRLDGSGNVFAGGFFTLIGGQVRNRIAKLSTSGTGAADTTWNPNANNYINSLALDDSGSLFAGGLFTAIGGQSRNYLAKLSASGTGQADPAWNPSPNDIVFSLARDLSGNLFTGGNFSSIGGLSRDYVAKVLASGAGLADASWNATGLGSVLAIALDLSGNVYLGGGGLRKVRADNADADATWSPNPDSFVYALELDGAGNVCVGGVFRTIAGQARAGYACLSPTAPPVMPVVTSVNATTFTVGALGTFMVTATGSPAPTLSMAGTLPSGVTFVPATGVLSGTPAAGTVGSYPLTFFAANSAGTANQSFTLTVAPNVPGKPVISSIVAGNNQATIDFPPPPSNGSPIVSYKARCSDGATTVEQTASAPPIVVTGLTNGVPYTCTVDATNGVGDSPQSDPSGVTPGGGVVPPPTTNVGSLDFGGQSMGTTSPAQEITITNPATASAAINITGISLSPQFGQSNNCTTLAVGASCKAQVTFSPAAVAGVLNSTVPVTGTLTIATSANHNLAVSLTGTAEKSLVTHYYRSILRRAPDSGGQTFWSNEAARVAALGADVNETWFTLAATFYRSGEYVNLNRNTTEYVRDLYNTFYNRAADDGGLDFWTGQINAGLPREVVLIAFMFSQEFANFTGAIFGNTGARAEVNTVMDFYRGMLARLPDDGGFNFWAGRFRTAQCAGGGAINAEVEAISSEFALSGEYGARGRNDSQYVTDLYNAFLRRGGDLGGFNFWVNQIAGGFRTRGQVRIEFKSSPEFQSRVNAISAQGCLQ